VSEDKELSLRNDKRNHSATALVTTVEKETFSTLDNPAELTDDQLANAVVVLFGKMRDYMPYIIALKERFDAGERDSLNRLRTPIKGCHTWTEFCRNILNRAPQSIGEAMKPKKVKQATPHQVTDAEFAEYEQDHPHIRQLTKKLLAEMEPADAVSALVNNTETPEPMAEAVVRIAVAENNESQKPSKTSELKALLEQHTAKARELTNLFADAEVSRSASENRFHLTLRNLTEEQVRQIAATGVL
jgi:hypothetical protein